MKINFQANSVTLKTKLFRGFADETRLSILNLLADGTKNVNEIVATLNLPQSTVSSHLSCLKECNLVTSKKDGRSRRYSLISPLIPEIMRKVDQLLKMCYSEIFNCVNYDEE